MAVIASGHPNSAGVAETQVKNSSIAQSPASPKRRGPVDDVPAQDGAGDTSKTVENALALLDTIARLGPLSLGELATELKLNRTVVYRLLTTLQRRCFVIKFGGSYVVGPTLIRLSEAVLPALRQIITPTLQRLSASIQETVSCAVRDGNSWVILDQVLDSYHAVHVREELGTRYPLHIGAHGYALMAKYSDDALAPYYAHTIVPESSRIAIASARQLGYAMSRGELRDGVSGIAVAGMIRNVPFSLAIIVPSVRAGDVAAHLAPLLEAASYVTSRIE